MAQRPRNLVWRTGVVRRANDQGIWLQEEEDWVNWTTYATYRPEPPLAGTTVRVGVDGQGWLREWTLPDGSPPPTPTAAQREAARAAAPPPVEPEPTTTEEHIFLGLDDAYRESAQERGWRDLLATSLHAAALTMQVVPDEHLPKKRDEAGQETGVHVKRTDATYTLARAWARRIWAEPVPSNPTRD